MEAAMREPSVGGSGKDDRAALLPRDPMGVRPGANSSTDLCGWGKTPIEHRSFPISPHPGGREEENKGERKVISSECLVVGTVRIGALPSKRRVKNLAQ